MFGAPIISAICHCDDCQEGARRIEALPNAARILDAAGGTPYILFRKDRVKHSGGSQLLRSYKLREESPTNRVVATCCNSAMFLGFDDGKHWISMYRARFQGDLPPPQMRVCTKFKPAGVEVPGDVPSYPKFPVRFLVKLLVSRIEMLFQR